MIDQQVSNKKSANPVFWIKDIPVFGDTILAPMDGFSDWPFRSLCSELGSAMSYTEFVRAQHIVEAYKHMAARLTFDQSERPMVFQIYGDDPDEIVKAALRVQDRRPDIIDINMGCPARKVVHGGAGVGLMKQPIKVARIFKKLSAALDIPVTGKIRIGWENCKSYKLIARIVEENGGSLIAVHGRTREQGYSGLADWDVIAEVKSAVKIPVIGNGDIKLVSDIERMKNYTGCQAVMVGRAAIGNPWIFAHLDREQVTSDMVYKMVREHLSRHMSFYGERIGIMLFRKHAMQYLKLHQFPRAIRTRIITQNDTQQFLKLLDQAFGMNEDRVPVI
ncbi:MAG: tRNA dihydrouridine synthase DusB [Chloroflexota bacterium]